MSQQLEKWAGVPWYSLVPASVSSCRYIQELYLKEESLEKAVDTMQREAAALVCFEIGTPCGDKSDLVRLVHRKIESARYLLLPPFRAELMGRPMLIVAQGAMSGKELHDLVFLRVNRYISGVRKAEAMEAVAQRCVYPFQLKFVATNGAMCSNCDWSEHHCLGCLIAPDSSIVRFDNNSHTIAVDWNMEFFNSYEESAMIRHPSVDKEADQQTQTFTLEECLDIEHQPEEIEMKCSQCDHPKHNQTTSVCKPPDVLAVQLQRFNHSFKNGKLIHRKLETMVKVPLENFNFSKYVNTSARGSRPVQYDLMGVVNHKGGVNAGHYIAYAKNDENGKWYCYNDRVCSEIDAAKVVTPMAYVMFFKRSSTDFPRYSQVSLYQEPQPSWWEWLCSVSSCCQPNLEKSQQQKRQQKIENAIKQK